MAFNEQQRAEARGFISKNKGKIATTLLSVAVSYFAYLKASGLL